MYEQIFSKVVAPAAPWVVLKFGGSSVGDATRWPKIEQIVRRHLDGGRRVLVVCSAASGVTDQLEALIAALGRGEASGERLAALSRRHSELGAGLGLDSKAVLAPELAGLEAACAACAGPVTPPQQAVILAHGELMSSRLATAWLARRGLTVARLDARHVLSAEVGDDRAGNYLSARCTAAPSAAARAELERLAAPVVVTQGFIASDPSGATVLLGRGGSDASAAYLAATIGAEAVEIWSDVPGLFTANPRAVADARLLRRLSFAEAEAIGALGAKALHPRTIEPLASHGIPIRLGWTSRPEVVGTKIGGGRSPAGPKAIVSRKQLALLTMWRRSSWQPVGFLAEVATRFHRRGLSMDLVATSTSEIRATVDLGAFPWARESLEDLLADLSEVCQPRLMSKVACVSVVGSGVPPRLLGGLGSADPFAGALVHMVGHAADGNHVSVVVDETAVDDLVAAAHRHLIAGLDDDSVFGPRWEVLAAQPPASDPADDQEVRQCATA